MDDRYAEARRLLLDHFGHPEFRPLQGRVVRSVLAGRDTLAVLPTGGGKSVCFQIPALVLGGFTLVVSPLISLMQDQVSAAVARGLAAASLAGPMTPAEISAVLDDVGRGAVRLLYTSPERLDRIAPGLAARGLRPALFAVDEAHCIAEWGHDFRPSYRLLRRARWRLGKPPVVALTGSATDGVRRDIVASLGLGGPSGSVDLHLGSFDRRNLWFAVRRVKTERERRDALTELIRAEDGMAIVYTPTRRMAEGVAAFLRESGRRAAAYHAGLDRERRRARLDAFLRDELDTVVATSAFGMGIDKPTVRLVVHWSMSPTPESYYQEAGRAGRDGGPARCILLYRRGDAEVHRRQLDVTFPPRKTAERVWAGATDPGRLPSAVRESVERLRRELRPERGPVDWRPVTRRRRETEARIDAMERYASAGRCRRASLLEYFGERLGTCAGCDRCRRDVELPRVEAAAAARLAALRRAITRLASPWPGGLLDPETLARLARTPPADGVALAAVRGVGPALARRYGGTILRVLRESADP